MSLEAIEDERLPEADDEISIGDFDKSMRDSVDKRLQPFGLRKFVRLVPQARRRKASSHVGKDAIPKAMGEYVITVHRRNACL